MENFWHILVYNFYLVHFCTHFSTFLKSAWNSAFLYTFFDFSKIIFWGYLPTVQKVLIFATWVFVNNFFFNIFFSYLKMALMYKKITNGRCSLYVQVRREFEAAVSITRTIWRGYSRSWSLFWALKSFGPKLWVEPPGIDFVQGHINCTPHW